ncbi:SPIR2 protein, partial [Leiothrix lutea]|nr:SPIR2 protein [Leiothrix lutea]
AAASVAPAPLRTADIRLRADGSLRLPAPPHDLPALLTPSAEAQMVQSLGFAVYRALDWGLDENEERELSPRLEQLIDLMTNSDSEDSGCATADEGYGGQDEEEEGGEGPPRSVRTFGQAMRLSHLCTLQASERRLRPLPQKQRTLHEKILEEIRQERKLRPVEQKGYSSLPCIPHACAGHLSSSSCLELSRCPASAVPARPRPRVLLKAPTLAEMEEMNLSEARGNLQRWGHTGATEVPLKRDRSFSEQDLAQLQSQLGSDQAASQDPEPLQPEPRPRSGTAKGAPCPCPQGVCAMPFSSGGTRQHALATASLSLPAGSVPASCHPLPDGPALPRAALGAVEERPEDGSSAAPPSSSKHLWLEFSHPVESLALTVEEMINVRRVLVKAEMEKFLQSKELYSSLRKGKVCCCCRAKFPLFSWPASCFFCKRSVCSSCSLKMKMPSKKLAHIPVYALGFESLPGSLLSKAPPLRRREPFHSLSGSCWRRVEEEFPHIYAQGSVLRDVCSDCAGFVTDVVSSSRRSVAVLNASAASRRHAKARSLYSDAW